MSWGEKGEPTRSFVVPDAAVYVYMYVCIPHVLQLALLKARMRSYKPVAVHFTQLVLH